MNRYALFALALLSSLFLVSCGSSYSTTSNYSRLTDRPSGNWEGSSWSGYTERQTATGNYIIGYEAYNRPGPESASYFTIVRAAERAAIDGQRFFYLRPGKMNSYTKNSYFKGYIVPGYSTRRTEEFETTNSCGHIVHHIREYDEWTPERVVAPRNVTNRVAKIKRKMSYKGSRSHRYDAYRVLSEALRNVGGYGRPRLSGPANAQLEMWDQQARAQAKLAEQQAKVKAGGAEW